jgi:hypothetical protein
MKRAFSLTVPETLVEAAHPDTTALIVYDMQVGILRQLSHAPSVLASVLRLLESRAQRRYAFFHASHVAA